MQSLHCRHTYTHIYFNLFMWPCVQSMHYTWARERGKQRDFFVLELSSTMLASRYVRQVRKASHNRKYRIKMPLIAVFYSSTLTKVMTRYYLSPLIHTHALTKITLIIMSVEYLCRQQKICIVYKATSKELPF